MAQDSVQRRPLAAAAEGHGQLAATERHEQWQGERVRPAAHGRPEQLPDIGAGQRSTDDRQPELEPADRRVQQAERTRPRMPRARSPAGRGARRSPRRARPRPRCTGGHPRRSDARRASTPATIRQAATTAASATVCHRTTRPSPRRRRGSKSNAMTAIGTVSAVYPCAACRLADTLRVARSVAARCRSRHDAGHTAGRARGSPAVMGGRDRRAWGHADQCPTSGPPGGWAGRRDRREGALVPTVPSRRLAWRSRSSVASPSGRPMGRRSGSWAGTRRRSSPFSS